MTDTEKLSCKSETEDDTYCPRAKYRTALSTCGEKSVDRLYLRAAAIAKGTYVFYLTFLGCNRV